MTISGTELERRIRTALASSDPDPKRIATRIADSLPAEDVRDVLINALSARVRSTMGRVNRDRRSGYSPLPSVPTIEAHQRLQVGPSTWKFVDDCTAVELRSVAGRSRQNAAGVIIDANRLCALADRLDAVGATVVRDLPAEQLAG